MSTYLVNVGSPPFKVLACTGEEYREEDEYPSDTHRRVQSRAENKIVFAPPSVEMLANDQGKKQTEDCPTAIVHASRRRQEIQAAHEERNVNSLPQRVGVSAAQDVNGDRENGANEEKIEKSGIPDLTLEIATRTNRTPDQ